MAQFFLDDDVPATAEPRSADEQHALDQMLYDPHAEAPDLLDARDRKDSKVLLTRGDERTAFAHALDTAPRNSKIVKTSKGAVLATPAGANLLTPFDPAQQLPLDAKVVKLGEAQFRLTIPNQHGDSDTLTGESVIALIAEGMHKLHG